MRRFPTFNGNIDRDSIALLLRHSNIPAPYTIYHDCWKLIPGTVLSIDTSAIERRALPAPTIYWSTAEVARESLSKPLTVSSDNAVDELESLLRNAVGDCMVSDAPIGAFLSGGIDSSTIVALMQAQSPEPVRTFSIGFTVESAVSFERLFGHFRSFFGPFGPFWSQQLFRVK